MQLSIFAYCLGATLLLGVALICGIGGVVAVREAPYTHACAQVERTGWLAVLAALVLLCLLIALLLAGHPLPAAR